MLSTLILDVWNCVYDGWSYMACVVALHFVVAFLELTAKMNW